MDNREHNFPQNLPIERITDQYLNSRATGVSSHIAADAHLDEDFLAAFVEGNLTRRESNATVKHLADCSFCRHKTGELIKLDFAFEDHAENFAAVKTGEPAKISEVLSGLLSRFFGSGDAAVFAHEEKPETDSEKEIDSEIEK